MTSAIALNKLPPPDVVEVLDFETIYAAGVAKLKELDPDYDADLESDSGPIVLEVIAYMSMVLRQRVNDAARACFLATARGNDLDNLGALFSVQRLVITPADPEKGTAAVLEDDDDLRDRIALAPASFSVAGPVAAYVFHARAASGDVLDASATSPQPDDIKATVLQVLSQFNAGAELVAAMQTALDNASWPGQVFVSVLSRQGDGTAPQALLDTVAASVGRDDVRPLTDYVTVQSAEIVPWSWKAILYFYAGPDSTVAMAAAQANADAFIAESRRLGRDIPLSALYAALQVPGVHSVELIEPTASLTLSDLQAGYCTGVTLQDGGIRG